MNFKQMPKYWLLLLVLVTGIGVGTAHLRRATPPSDFLTEQNTPTDQAGAVQDDIELNLNQLQADLGDSISVEEHVNKIVEAYTIYNDSLQASLIEPLKTIAEKPGEHRSKAFIKNVPLNIEAVNDQLETLHGFIVAFSTDVIVITVSREDTDRLATVLNELGAIQEAIEEIQTLLIKPLMSPDGEPTSEEDSRTGENAQQTTNADNQATIGDYPDMAEDDPDKAQEIAQLIEEMGPKGIFVNLSYKEGHEDLPPDDPTIPEKSRSKVIASLQENIEEVKNIPAVTLKTLGFYGPATFAGIEEFLQYRNETISNTQLIRVSLAPAPEDFLVNTRWRGNFVLSLLVLGALAVALWLFTKQQGRRVQKTTRPSDAPDLNWQGDDQTSMSMLSMQQDILKRLSRLETRISSKHLASSVKRLEKDMISIQEKLGEELGILHEAVSRSQGHGESTSFPSSAQLGEVTILYRQQPTRFYITDTVAPSQESQEAFWSGRKTDFSFITSDQGDYYIVTQDQRTYYVVLRENFPFSSGANAIIKMSYEYDHKPNPKDLHRNYLELASVEEHGGANVWVLKTRGHLSFIDGSFKSSVALPPIALPAKQKMIVSDNSSAGDHKKALTQEMTQLRTVLAEIKQSVTNLSSQDTDRSKKVQALEQKVLGLQVVMGEFTQQLHNLQQFVPSPEVNWVQNYNQSASRLRDFAVVVEQTDASLTQYFQGIKDVSVHFERNPQGIYWIMPGKISERGDQFDYLVPKKEDIRLNLNALQSVKACFDVPEQTSGNTDFELVYPAMVRASGTVGRWELVKPGQLKLKDGTP
ncbi:MAG: hypothetical protein AAGD25_11255 [Cyanobacteria bacterium P01_F01_bin.150]